MKRVLLSVLVVLMVITGCEKQDLDMIYEVDGMKLGCPVKFAYGPENSVIGEWMLVKTNTTISEAEEKITDQSCDEFIYFHRFQSDGTLIAGQEAPHGDPGIALPYEFSLSPLNESAEEPYSLKIQNGNLGNSEYAVDILENGRILKLNGSYIENTYADRSIRYFIRIK